MFTNMKVGAKLGFGFGVVILVMIVISGIGITRMARLNDSIGIMANDRWPKTVMLNEIVDHSSRIGIALRNMMLSTSKDDRQKMKERILESRKIIGGHLEKLEPLMTLPRGKEMLAQLKTLRGGYIAGQETLFRLLETERTAADARAYLQNELRPILLAYQEQAHKFVTFQGELMEASAKEAQDAYIEARNLTLALLALASAVAAGIAFGITRNLTRQLGGEPDYAATIARRVAEGDLTQHIELRTGDTSSLLAAMRSMVERLSGTIGQVRSAADNLSSAAEEVTSTSMSLSQAASEQAASIEETSSSMEEMSASISQNTENAKVTNGIAGKSATEAAEGGEAVRATVDAMKSIASKISIIDDIAYQTNLLALNAAIEAARAGEHGKGFAVVAAEVRKLAERSQVAAQEIGELAGSSVKTSEKAGQLLEDMVPSISKTAELVQEITAASEEQTTGASQINTAMNQLAQTTQQNASASEQLSATAEEMSGQAEQLQQLMGFFKTVADGGRREATIVSIAAARRQPRPVPHKPPVASVPVGAEAEYVSF
ncbi:MAG: methyl-accepting chemotaxis protein [Rhodocyclaceae bacterium]